MHEAEIELPELAFAPVRVLHRADAGIGTVNRFAACNRCLEPAPALADTGHALGTDGNGYSAATDGVESDKIEGLCIEKDSCHGMECLQQEGGVAGKR